MKIIIAGSCALESELQLKELVRVIKDLGLTQLRASLWKPRTEPGWEGLGFGHLSLLLEETLPHGITPSTEIGSADHARMVVNTIGCESNPPKIMVWLGSRNQNHNEQRSIGKILSESPNITLMFKNQMWEDERHWLGILEHILSGGFPPERLWICHRGFAPGGAENPQKLRNLPNFEMAMRVKEKTQLPMILDPSHIGGTQKNVIEVCKQSLRYDFDGYMIEMHPTPDVARTDQKQQLTPDQLKEVVGIIREHSQSQGRIYETC